MADITPPKVGIKDVHKMPWAYVLMVMGGLLGAFATWAITSNTGTVAKQTQTIVWYRDDKERQRRITDSVISNLNNKIFELQEQRIRELNKKDSANSSVLSEPAKQLLKAINK